MYRRAVLAVLAASTLLAASSAASARPAGSSSRLRFVAAANRLCGATIVNLRRLLRESNRAARARRGLAEVDKLIDSISRLTAPRGDETRIARIVVSFRRFSVALHQFARAHGETAVWARVKPLMRAGNDAHRAAVGYGLRTCAQLFK